MSIPLKTPEQIEKMRAAGRVVYLVHERIREVCEPGVTTRQIDEAACELYTSLGAKGLFKNYPTYKPGEGFPGNLCISVNDEVVHGIPGERVVQECDVVSCDCGVELNGWFGDAANTIMVEPVSRQVKKLCEVTQHVLQIAIENIRPGRRWSDIARLMQNYAERQGMGVVRDFVGHGIGRKMHEPPQVPNYWSRELRAHDIRLEEGMVLAIEPMCNLGTDLVEVQADQWTVLTQDRKPSAHYEHTVAITASGADVLTDGR